MAKFDTSQNSDIPEQKKDPVRESLWKWFNASRERFRNLCHNDEWITDRAWAAIAAREVAANDLCEIPKDYVLTAAGSDEFHALTIRMINARDKATRALGKGEAESWDLFFQRWSDINGRDRRNMRVAAVRLAQSGVIPHWNPPIEAGIMTHRDQSHREYVQDRARRHASAPSELEDQFV